MLRITVRSNSMMSMILSALNCHDITMSRGCLIAGLPLICTGRAEHYYKSMGWSSFHEIARINTINNPHVHVLRL